MHYISDVMTPVKALSDSKSHIDAYLSPHFPLEPTYNHPVAYARLLSDQSANKWGMRWIQPSVDDMLLLLVALFPNCD